MQCILCGKDPGTLENEVNIRFGQHFPDLCILTLSLFLASIFMWFVTFLVLVLEILYLSTNLDPLIIRCRFLLPASNLLLRFYIQLVILFGCQIEQGQY